MLRVYNTLSRKLEEFKPLNPKKVGMYACGMTVYDHTHIGSMRKYTNDDVFRRALEYFGYSVRHVMNVTDVGHLVSDADEGEDKLEKGARREGISAWKVARKYEKEFFDVLQELNILHPTIVCRATEHIPEQIALVQKLGEKGFTYRISDGVYFDTNKFPRYADFARLNIAELKEGARVEANPEKKNPTDFALWKFSPKDKKRDMEWESPWGTGFPGWHLECSAMSMKYLGEMFDIHTGGIEHIPVHHTNEIAQSECATGKPFVHYWIHSEHLLVENTKMGKSLGNFYTFEDVQQHKINPRALRYFFFSAHYRSKQNFTWDALAGAQNALEKLYAHIREYPEASDREAKEFEDRFQTALEDDFNMPQALAVLWELVKSDTDPAQKKASLLKFDRILGLNLAQVAEEKTKISPQARTLIDARGVARTTKDFQRSDELRNELLGLGLLIEDTPEGQKVRKVR